MKKAIILINLFYVISSTGQNAFYDTQFMLTLNKESITQLEDANTDKMIFLSIEETRQLDNAKKFFTDPFDPTISDLDLDYVHSAIRKYNDAVMAGVNAVGGVSPFGAAGIGALGIIPDLVSGNFSLSGDQQTKLLDGLTKYYTEEFKKARAQSYMQALENTIGQVGEIQLMFPNTYEKLKMTDLNTFPDLGDEYKEVFDQDLKAILDNLINHIDTYDQVSGGEPDRKYKVLNRSNVDRIRANQYYGSLKLSADIGSKLINSYHIVDLLNHLDNNYYSDTLLLPSKPLGRVRSLDEKIGLVLHGASLIQHNLLDTSKNQTSQFSNVWINFEQLKKLKSDQSWTYFAGLMYHQDKKYFEKVFFANPGARKLNKKEIKKIKRIVFTYLDKLKTIQDYRASLNEENLKGNFADYLKLSINLIDTNLNFGLDKLNYKEIEKIKNISNYTFSIYDNIRTKEHGNTVHYSLLLLREFLGEASVGWENTEKLIDVSKFVEKAVNAENSDEAKELIKAFAAPPASYIQKREYRFNVSITGQPGYFFSMESLDGQWGFVSGLTLPMGFDLTWKLKHGENNSHSLGLFIQLIDLGSMLNFRLSNDSVTLPDNVTFEDIFSPGGAINLGFKNSPINLGIGYQYTPALRTITLEKGNDIQPIGHRVFVRMVWDIPFVNIYHSKKR